MPYFTTSSNEERLSLEKLAREYKLATRVARNRELKRRGRAGLLKKMKPAADDSTSTLQKLAQEHNAILELSAKHRDKEAEIKERLDV